MNDNYSDGGDPLAQAAQWHARLQAHPLPTTTVQDFYIWRQVPAHRAAFEEVSSIHERTAEVKDSPAVQDAISAALNRTSRAPVGAPLAGSKRGWAMASAAIAMLVAGWGVFRWQDAPVRFTTKIGERREITLDDGSKVMLATNTHLLVRYSVKARVVTLDTGEAYFTVAHNPERPFTVSAGRLHVTATGTQFDVRRTEAANIVTLIRGGVIVAGPEIPLTRLVAGESLTTTRDGPLKVKRADSLNTTAWTHDRIVLDGVTLAEAVAEENRYLDKPIRLGAPTLARTKLSGTLRAGDADAFVEAATATLPLAAVRNDDGLIELRAR